MTSPNLKARIAARDVLLGTFLKTPSPMICEVLGKTELDAVCVDAEHAPFDRGDIDACLLALRHRQMPALVRVPTQAPEHLLNALDCGADGVLVPHVTSADVAARVVAAAHYGPGGRGFAGSTRAADYTGVAMATHLEASAARTAVIAQIEDVPAVEQIEEIAAVPGLDCLFVGRADLTVALGAQSPKSPEVVAAVDAVCRAGQAAGVPVGMFLADLSELPHWRALGATVFLLSSDHSMMLSGAAALIDAFRGQVGADYNR